MFGEPNVLESTFELLKTLCIVIAHVLAGERHSTLPKILERGLVGELHVLPLLRRHVSEKIVEDVKSSLARGSTCDVLAFKIVVEGLDAAQASTLGELELGVFSETQAIRVEEHEGIPERFKHRLNGRDLVHDKLEYMCGSNTA